MIIDDTVKEIETDISSLITDKIVFLGDTIQINRKRKTKMGTNKMKMPRKVTKENKWITHLQNDDLNLENQICLLETIASIKTPKHEILIRELKRKIQGYKQQDIEKSKYRFDEFVDLEFVIELLKQHSNCFYCNTPIKLLYIQSRDPQQWTLERIDNKVGHTKRNVKVSCLSCNIKRRTMYHEKYLFTKQLVLTKLI